ncbi:ankyrin repeat domain-containing protein [Muricauda oceani]|uniref:Ankyrin repeat domain-containing protein n=1 Tax=Flagellimonas oceani TaxID=2698672 RepID=A0A6G7J7X1_9FLAO|nr:ankyrin repeat domain-containing protein [Allomuricauda oceani]MBW8243010.1 ankyrin repeat domain-containing protein [Allomuricauda oceani]QII46634.1 ankyrin repeat domain-containing protein [Allomuricauda oceani]
MKAKTIKSVLFGIITVLTTAVTTAQGGSENPFMDRDYWASQPSLADIDAKIAEGYSITEANRGGFDPTTFAIFGGNPVATINHLIEKGNDVNKRTHDSRTYIFWAASRGDLEVMQYLVEKGAKTDLKDSHGYSLTQFTAATGQTDPKIYDFLIKNGADLKNEKDHDGRNVLLVAAPRVKDLDLIDYFVSKGLNLNTTDGHGNGIFNIAAQGGNIDVLKALADRGVSTEKNPKTNENAILFASRGGRGSSNGLEVFEYLEGLGLDANITSTDGTTPLHNISRSSDHLAIYDYFIGKGVDPNAADKDGNTPLLNAATRNKLEVVKYLAEKTKNINHTNKEGHSALALALQNNSGEVVNYLISQGAKTDVLDKDGNNLAYYLFATRGNPRDFDEKVAALRKKGFDFKQTQPDKSTVWHLAVAKNDLGLLKSVSAFGADINAKDSQGNTVLHYAAMKSNNADMLKYLIANGADTKSMTEFGETPYDLAVENELLKQNNVNLDFLN